LTFEHGAQPLQVKAADLREVRAYLRSAHPKRHIVSIGDELGNLAGFPPGHQPKRQWSPATGDDVGAGRTRRLRLRPVLGARL